MTKKSIQLSSSGLKNIILDEKDFTFIFDKEEIHMNSYLAEFISPKVSHLHRSDKTISSICISCPKDKDMPSLKEIFSEDIVDIIHQISYGSSVEIDEEQSSKMKFISIFLGNEELYRQLDNLYPNNFNQSDVNTYIDKLIILYRFSSITNFDFDISSTIDFISNNFYLVDIHNLLQLRKEILYPIISNKNLQIDSEDSFFDFISEYIENNYSDISEEEELSFLNEIKIENLSDNKFGLFLEMINPYKISSNLWQNLCHRFQSKEINYSKSDRYNKNKKSDTNNNNNDNNDIGIIAHLIKSGNKNSFQISSSSIFDSSSSPQNLISLNGKSYFSSKDRQDSWVKFNFKNKKVQIRSYSMTSGPYNAGFYHPRSWVIEGSNDDVDEYEWESLDVQKNNTSLDGVNVTKSFDINKSNGKFYKFIRLRQIGKTASGDNYLVLSHIEFYGLIKDS